MRICLLWLMWAALSQAQAQQMPLSVEEAETETLQGLSQEPEGPPMSGGDATRQADEVGSKLRCPQCQGLSVTASKADAARAMYKRVHELVEAGYSEAQILDYFSSRYGEGILLEPKAEGMNWLIWAGPILALLIGVAVVGSRSGRGGPSSSLLPEDTEEDAGLVELDRRRGVEADPHLQAILDEIAERSRP